MRCSVCGADNLEGAVYCEDCGARLPSAGAAPPPPPPPQPAPAPADPPPQAATPPMPSPEAAAPAPAAGPTTCAACGATNQPNVAFCEDCGAALGGTGAPSVDGPPVSYDTPAASTGSAPAQPTAPAGGRRRLVLNSGREFPLDKDVVLIGRRSPVDGIFPEVDLTDYDTESYISRRHAKILVSDASILFEDLGSSNGSFLNGTRLQSGVQQVVRDGDALRLGKTEMVLRMS